MEDLSRKRCANHASREAVARCPECVRFYCRECITEHQGRVLCSTCLARTRATADKEKRAGMVLGMARFSGGVFLAWMLFYYIGRALCALPDTFHEGGPWRGPW